jgi:LmbE family N-acetylglucosaminyl deacetylase
MSSPRVLGVFAHPDDEVFCAGGSLARYVDAGAEAMVVSMTKGQAGQIRASGPATRKTLGDVRAKELEACCAVLGVQHVRTLDYQDGGLADLRGHVLRDEVSAVLTEFEPDVVVTFGDDGAYGHPDHVAVSRATTAAFKRTLGTTGPARLYHSHFPRSRLLMLDRLSSWLVELGQRFHGEIDFVHALSLFAQESTTMRYASDHVDTSWAPAGTYLVEQGEPAASLYLILSGKAEVLQEQSDGTIEKLREIGRGEFFGELGVVERSVRTASVVAIESTTCLVFSADEPSLYDGRGEDAHLVLSLVPQEDSGVRVATTEIDVSAWVERKVAGIAAHRTQYPIEPGMFPLPMLEEMFGREHFIRVFPSMPPETDLLPAP